MKIALIGYGKMGHAIERVALSQGHAIVACINSSEWDDDAIQQAEVCIEFTHPDAVIKNISKLAKLKKTMVIGTTGWLDKLEEVRQIVAVHQIGAIYSANFSLGVNLFLEILERASSVMQSFAEEYDVAGIEWHHRQKKDAPSGTALEISKVMEENMGVPISFSSVRCGSIPGTHSIVFDSSFDTITLTHEARNRDGFALGAVQAAEWIRDKHGLYTFRDCLTSFRR